MAACDWAPVPDRSSFLAPGANAVFIDDAGWLTVGSLGGMESLRVGEAGIIATHPLPFHPAIATAVNALRQRCGGNPDVVIVDSVMRTPVCDLTPSRHWQTGRR